MTQYNSLSENKNSNLSEFVVQTNQTLAGKLYGKELIAKQIHEGAKQFQTNAATEELGHIQNG